MLVLISFVFLAARLVSAGWTNTDFATTLHCTTQYASQGNASNVYTHWLTTETETTTEMLWFTKTEIYTPKASITTLPAIATSYDRSLIDEWTSVITTATITSSITLKSITTVTVAATTTTIIVAEYPDSNKTHDSLPPPVETQVKNKKHTRRVPSSFLTPVKKQQRLGTRRRLLDSRFGDNILSIPQWIVTDYIRRCSRGCRLYSHYPVKRFLVDRHHQTVWPDPNLHPNNPSCNRNVYSDC
jgi:hypothetical protein